MRYNVLIAQWGEVMDLSSKIRFDVFVAEQNVPESLEIDEEDQSAWHTIVFENGLPIGTARLVIEDIHSGGNPTGRIGRMAVLKDFRNQGVGRELILSLLEFGKNLNIHEYYLHAQLTAQSFYEKFGFISEGEVFEEAGILHQSMRLKI